MHILVNYVLLACEQKLRKLPVFCLGAESDGWNMTSSQVTSCQVTSRDSLPNFMVSTPTPPRPITATHLPTHSMPYPIAGGGNTLFYISVIGRGGAAIKNISIHRESDLLISLAEDHDPLKWDHTLGPVRAGDDSGTEHVYGVRGAPCRASGLRARYLFSTNPYNTDLLIQEPDQKHIIGNCDRFSSNTNPVRKTHEMLLGSKTRRPVIGLILFAARSRRAALAAFARLEILSENGEKTFKESNKLNKFKIGSVELPQIGKNVKNEKSHQEIRARPFEKQISQIFPEKHPTLWTHQQLEKIRPFLSVLLVKFSAARFRLRCGNRKAQYVAGRATYDSKDEGPAGGSAGSRTELSAQTPNWICWMAKGLAALEVRTDRWGLEASAPRQTCWRNLGDWRLRLTMSALAAERRN
ncbi:unnamed protein product [Nesidiocoris tenuis]|uniref:Uncharacterized protein n=1 Tax=Nesidiocoris tenuis TaxID=355587 RepID=A0A6H5HH71_9HEMI|nr:unnamed protein product [Nesidiocoris tenuis]